MIRFDSVHKVYEDGFHALKDISFEVEKGELLALIGPSGCGKTTTMRMINRLMDPTDGKIFINGEDISLMDTVQMRRDIGYVIQQIGLFPHMTIGENISLVPKLKKWDVKKITGRVDELLDLVGLDPVVFRDRYPHELSGGQQQRVGVIRALAAEPPIVLMDEPFSALDPISREQLQDELVRLQEEIHKTIVFVTHDMDEALKIANRLAIMKDGEIVQLDTPDRILRYPKDDFVRGFIGEQRLNDSNELPVAKDLMLKRVVTAGPKRGLAEALKLMKKYTVDSLLVTEKDGSFIGRVTIQKLEKHYREEDKQLQHIMEPVETIHAEAAVSEVADRFTHAEITSIPVLENHRVIGLITRSSMMRGLADWDAASTPVNPAQILRMGEGI
jgi:osmoprotectant transport system ATP-binding protein